MSDFTTRVSLKKPDKPEPWTDPETGEIYPGGKPVQQAAGSEPSYTQPNYAQPESRGFTYNAEVYPSQAQQPPQRIDISPTTIPQGEQMCFCRACGKQVAQTAQFCPACGAKQFDAQPQPQIINNYYTTGENKTVYIRQGDHVCNKWVAFVLCVVLGVLGVHRFYEHKIGTGILWLLTGGMFGIGWIVDMVLILQKPTHYVV